MIHEFHLFDFENNLDENLGTFGEKRLNEDADDDDDEAACLPLFLSGPDVEDDGDAMDEI